MKKSTLSLLSGLFLGFASYLVPKKYDPQIGEDSQKGPPGIKTIDLVFKQLNQRVGYKTNNSEILKKNEFNQI